MLWSESCRTYPLLPYHAALLIGGVATNVLGDLCVVVVVDLHEVVACPPLQVLEHRGLAGRGRALRQCLLRRRNKQ